MKDIELEHYYLVVWNCYGFRLDNWDIRRTPDYRNYGILDPMSDYDVMLVVGNIHDTPELMERVLHENS